MNKINANKAKRLFNEGREIYVNPCKLRLVNDWTRPHMIVKNDMNPDFDSIINEITVHNCNNETGRYLHYYVVISIDEIIKNLKGKILTPGQYQDDISEIYEDYSFQGVSQIFVEDSQIKPFKYIIYLDHIDSPSVGIVLENNKIIKACRTDDMTIITA